MADETTVKPAVWKQLVGGVLVLLAFILGAALGVIVKQLVPQIPQLIFFFMPWIVAWVAYRGVKRWIGR